MNWLYPNTYFKGMVSKGHISNFSLQRTGWRHFLAAINFDKLPTNISSYKKDRNLQQTPDLQQ